MLKKLIIASACLASLSAFAGSAPAPLTPYNPFSGFYLGIAGGMDHFGARQDINLNGVQLASVDGGSNISFIGQFNLGYQYGWDNWTLGLEGLANTTDTKEKVTITNLSGSGVAFRNRLVGEYDFGLSVNGGYRWYQTLFYGLFGPVWTRFTLKQVDLVKETSNKTVQGLMAGIGAEQALTDHLRLKEQFVYTFYPNEHYRFVSALANSTKLHAFQRATFFLGVAYQFA